MSGVVELNNMFILAVHWDLRAIWVALTITGRLYVLCLLAGATCSGCVLTRSAWHLRRIRHHSPSMNEVESERELRKMSAKMRLLRQLHMSLLLLFGVCAANEVFAGLRTIQNSAASLSPSGIEVFEPFLALAFITLSVLFALHLLQWMLEQRVESTPASIRRQSGP